VLLIDGVPHEIQSLVRVDPWTATVTPNDLAVAGAVQYSRPLPTGGRTAPS